jgi:hypothetical protein
MVRNNDKRNGKVCSSRSPHSYLAGEGYDYHIRATVETGLKRDPERQA